MTEPANVNSPKAWQPFTPRGVAAFAEARGSRLFFFQATLALLTALSVVWFLKAAWFPIVRSAIRALPETGSISAGKLNWQGDSPQLLAEGHFLAFVVDTNHSATVRSPAHIQVEFGRRDVRVISIGGYYSEFYYSNPQPIPFNREELEAWWGAWQPPISWLAFSGAIVWCFASWTSLTGIYFLPVWLAAFFANKRLNFSGAWKLVGAALIPGAVLMIIGTLLYGVGLFDLIQLAAVFAVHVVLGWVYVIWAVLVLPKVAIKASEDNPFRTESSEPQPDHVPTEDAD